MKVKLDPGNVPSILLKMLLKDVTPEPDKPIDESTYGEDDI